MVKRVFVLGKPGVDTVHVVFELSKTAWIWRTESLDWQDRRGHGKLSLRAGRDKSGHGKLTLCMDKTRVDMVN